MRVPHLHPLVLALLAVIAVFVLWTVLQVAGHGS